MKNWGIRYSHANDREDTVTFILSNRGLIDQYNTVSLIIISVNFPILGLDSIDPNLGKFKA